jgi:hypothetical protein
MSNHTKVYEQARIAFQKLSPTNKDLILVRLPDDIDPVQAQLLAEILQPLNKQYGCAIVFTRDGVDIELFKEAAMNELGWYKLFPSAIPADAKNSLQ